jgi:hypothetical protein
MQTAQTLAAADPALDRDIDAACARIAPTWPLDQFIAVNPLWGWTERPLPEASARLAALSGSRFVMPRAWFRGEWDAGRLAKAHLQAAIDEAGAGCTVADLVALLGSDEPAPARRALVADVVDAGRDLVHRVSWCDFVTHATSQYCAAWFDDGQARLGPDRSAGLYPGWLRQAAYDLSPRLLMGMKGFREHVRRLPGDPRALIAEAVDVLGIAPDDREGYFTAALLRLNGWASWCAYERWQARLAGGGDDSIIHLLALRLAWELILFRSGGADVAAAWRRAVAAWPAADRAATASQDKDWLLQRAMELAWQAPVCAGLADGLRRETPAAAVPAVQAAFCIDVRSEVMRRAIEATTPAIQTLGFAGFFGLPIDYQPLGAAAARAQLPGLLAPAMRAADTCAVPGLEARRQSRLDVAGAFREFKLAATSGFSFVESFGLLYAGKLVSHSLGHGRPAPHPEGAGLRRAESGAVKPRLVGAAEAAQAEPRADLAAGILRAMGLTRGFARLVLLAGHGSETVNNPHAAGLDCGACCGQTGEVNARALAALLNEPAVRGGLAARGIEVPASTWFLAGLHNTTTDEVLLYDTDEVPATHRDDLASLTGWLAAAGERARAERAGLLGLGKVGATELRGAIEARARDWSQVRPEWGLADNAAFIVAPRERSRHLDLGGRSFLHDYRWQDDDGFGVLELIMTAPMVVTHWINLQYYASTVDNRRFGSGNKVLHNVVGGHLGVFEGNGGDLRIGLPMQSLHDGERFVHTPRRLAVFIEAPRAAIDAVIAKHAKVRELVENGWIHLFQLDADTATVLARRADDWRAVVDGAG